jgi:hypothetical protein
MNYKNHRRTETYKEGHRWLRASKPRDFLNAKELYRQGYKLKRSAARGDSLPGAPILRRAAWGSFKKAYPVMAMFVEKSWEAAQA